MFLLESLDERGQLRVVIGDGELYAPHGTLTLLNDERRTICRGDGQKQERTGAFLVQVFYLGDNEMNDDHQGLECYLPGRIASSSKSDGTRAELCSSVDLCQTKSVVFLNQGWYPRVRVSLCHV